ncbi:MAG: hypothetical protein HYS20_13600 [Rhodocyclales bacterium]|nr:hypothetical protein [Rhodocyclales bacterium]
MNVKSRILAVLLGCALIATPAAGAGQSATSRPSKAEWLRQQGRDNNNQAAAPAPAIYPRMSNDFLTGLEVLGVRPGMTLGEARAELETWGATLETGDRELFVYYAHPGANYRGHPDAFNPDTPIQNGRAGMTTLFVYPVNPQGDIADPANLMVYFVHTKVLSAGSRAGVMSEAEFLSQGQQRAGQKLHTAMSGNRAECGFLIPDYARRVAKLAGVDQPQTRAHLAAWKQCGTVAMVDIRKTGARVYGYLITYSDATLAERALAALRVSGAERRRTQQ